ncbi:hypothetical protein NLJ89_g11270 [Agrocybe chaxingu]|uniref:Uncharacterized protein n=1 Tax=Agrocybe chaxingu TaxID=84603 RepID=A0A9W8JQB1_9AGAR|nr:hypothetical protein NLJ89_g11270 [Agrocybe chaxingu]
MIAKIQGAKRKRDEDEDEDVNMDDAGGSDDPDGAEGWMDVDDDESAPKKRVKTNSGRVINKREPRTNRQMAGLRDEGQFTKANKLRNLGQRPRNMLAKAGESDRAIKVKMPKHLFSGKRKGGKTQRR